MLARQGVTLDRSTLSNWVGRACWWLTPLYDLMVGTVLSSAKLFADDTTLPVLDPGRGRTKTGRLWTSYGLSKKKADSVGQLRSRAVHKRAATRPRLQGSTVLVPSRTLTRRRVAPVPLRGILDGTCARRSATGRSGRRNVALSRTKEWRLVQALLGWRRAGSNMWRRCSRVQANSSSRSATPRRARPYEWPRLRSAS